MSAAEIGHAGAPRPPRAPWLTMGLNLALIATIFLTRERWAAWQLQELGLELRPWGTVEPTFSDGRRVVLSLQDEPPTVLWNAEASRAIASYDFDIGLCCAFSPDGTSVVVNGLGDEQAFVLDAETGSLRATLAVGADGMRCVSFSADSALVIAGCEDGYARVWRAADGSQVLKLGPHSDAVYSAELSPNGSAILTAAPGDVRIWDAESGVLLKRLLNAEDELTYAAFCAQARRILIWFDGRIDLVDAASGERLTRLEICGLWALSPDSQTFAVPERETDCVLAVDARTGEVIWKQALGGLEALLFADGGKRVLASRGSAMTVLDASTGRAVGEVPFYGAGPFPLSSDGTRFLYKERWTPARLYSARTGELLAELPYADPIGFLGNDSVALLHSGETDEARVHRRVRPERWWGVLWLWHFWVIIALALALIASGWRDLRRMQGRTNERA
ncbi:MAG: WD40 repeat domain-containing protein [Planctomycetota bacterium]|jgi:outer membrane protein assembly factor BamB